MSNAIKMPFINAPTMAEKLKKLLISSGKFDDTIEEFVAKQDDNLKVLFLEKLLKKHDLMPTFRECYLDKNPITSNSYRKKGNMQYNEKKYMCATLLYNASLCLAPPASEQIGMAYANRSAAFLELKRYDKSLENIELARNHNYPKDKLDKLKEREEKCLELKDNNPLSNLYEECEKLRNELLQMKLTGNKKAPCYIANCLELRTSPEWGHHIITNQDLKVGTVIAVEEPFSKIKIPSFSYDRCANCLKSKELNLFPCDGCCVTMFCSEECKKMAWEIFHQYECDIAYKLHMFFPDLTLIGLRTFFEGLGIFKGDPGALNEYLRSIENKEATVFDFDCSKMNEMEKKKSLLHAICAQTSGDPRVTSHHENFVENCTSAILINLLLNHSKLGSILNDEETRAMFRKFIFQHSPKCFRNAHQLSAGSTNYLMFTSSIGSGMFPFSSLLNHSCAPNVSKMNAQLKNYLRVMRPVKAGEQLFVSYGPHHLQQSVHERQQKLIDDYKFLCRCIACESPADFPLINQLKRKDKEFEKLMPCQGKTFTAERQDAAIMSKQYQQLSRYMDLHDAKDYPSQEIAFILDCLFGSSGMLSFITLCEDYSYFKDH